MVLTCMSMNRYVSYYYQNDLYTNYAKLVGEEFADMVGKGFSEHQTGLAVDSCRVKMVTGRI